MYQSRRSFVKQAVVISAVTALGKPLAMMYDKSVPPLSFSTLGCPDWSLQEILSFASANGYQGIELRGLQRQMDLSQCSEFSEGQIAGTLRQIKDRGLSIVNLGSGCNLHISAPVKRKENLDEAKRFIDLAQKVSCPFIRVFPNNLPKDQDKTATLELIAEGLQALGDFAKGSSVRVLMETHGDVVQSKDIQTVMKLVDNAQTGLVWDIANMWTITKEPPAEVYTALKQWIYHVHVKDAVFEKGLVKYVFLGRGVVPVFTALDTLAANNYTGYYSFEWEKLWHPELPSPELALADYPSVMRKHFRG